MSRFLRYISECALWMFTDFVKHIIGWYRQTFPRLIFAVSQICIGCVLPCKTPAMLTIIEGHWLFLRYSHKGISNNMILLDCRSAQQWYKGTVTRTIWCNYQYSTIYYLCNYPDFTHVTNSNKSQDSDQNTHWYIRNWSEINVQSTWKKTDHDKQCGIHNITWTM